RVRKRERVSRRLSPLPASDPAAGRDLSGPELYWPALGSCCMLGRPALGPDPTLEAARNVPLAASRTLRVVTDCEYAGVLAQPVFSEGWQAGNPAPPGARNAHSVVSGSPPYRVCDFVPDACGCAQGPVRGRASQESPAESS